ncbi:unnamed protein product [Trichobilharzia regenti]|nr:unnamed protein product [Trichobilharzia regenti]
MVTNSKVTCLIAAIYYTGSNQESKCFQESFQIKGWYPILNVSGHVIGNVRLRVFLRHVQPENSNQSALNTTGFQVIDGKHEQHNFKDDYVSTDLSKHFPSINCKNCNMSSVSLLHDHEVQVSKQQSERSTQTEYDTKEVFRPSSPSIKIHLYNELNETAKTTEVSVLDHPSPMHCVPVSYLFNS